MHSKLLWRRSLYIDIATGFGCGFAGDAGAQLISAYQNNVGKAKHEHDLRRSLAVSFNCGVTAPAWHVWYRWLDRRLRCSPRKVVFKVAADNLFTIPFFEIPVFVVNTGLLCGSPFSTCMEQLHRGHFKSWVCGLAVWVPAGLVVFRVVPVRLQVVAFSVIGAFWEGALSIINLEALTE